MARSLLGCHWIRTHPDNRDLPHIEKMQYRSVKLFEWSWRDRDFCRDLLAVLPKDAYILARDHPLSEQDIWADPASIGKRQADEWAEKVRSGNYHLPIDRSFFLGKNEPDATHGDRNALDIYTSAYLDRLQVHGLRGGAFNFSTGHPRTVDGTGGTQADYTVFERSHQAIIRGHHIAALHIYGTAAQPCVPGHFDRLRACTWQDVEWVVGECGADEHVIGGGNHDGYLISMNGHIQDHCAWLDTLIMGVNDARIHSWQVFTYDFSHPWSSFNVREIRDALESYPWRHTQVQPTTTPPTTTTVHLPNVGTGPQPAPHPAALYVQATAGANFRTERNTRPDSLIYAIPFGTRVEVRGFDTDYTWTKVEHDGKIGWIYTSLLSVDKPQQPQPTPAPQPVASGDKWQRAIDWVLQWEGGYQNVANDKGNWTGCEVGEGENKGTKYGISACSYPDLDIRALTLDEARSIYQRDYWQASGASALDYPLCLLVLDTAVLHGVSTAKKWLAETGPNPYAFAAKRLRTYTKLDNWDFWGKGWANRVADLLEEMSK